MPLKVRRVGRGSTTYNGKKSRKRSTIFSGKRSRKRKYHASKDKKKQEKEQEKAHPEDPIFLLKGGSFEGRKAKDQLFQDYESL